LLIFTGLILLEVFRFNLRGFSVSQKHQQSLADWGSAGAFVLGLVFALVFCPISAALFFGSLIPLALSHRSGAGLPLVYGLGTGLPVLLFAFLIALGVRSLSGWFERLTRLEALMRKLTGGVFIVVGLYYVMVYLLKIL
ncbi:MAG: cytochrome c biogenesis protein CcdA, partial [Candidatus Omnitrophota bacterium]